MSWQEISGGDALGEDEAMGVTVGAHQIMLCRSGGLLHALSNVCTHQYALLSEGYVEDGCIECPLHQGRFDLKTGAALCAPVTEPVRVYPVKTENGKIYVDIGD